MMKEAKQQTAGLTRQWPLVKRLLLLTWQYRGKCIQIVFLHLILQALTLGALGFFGLGVDFVRFQLAPGSAPPVPWPFGWTPPAHWSSTTVLGLLGGLVAGVAVAPVGRVPDGDDTRMVQAREAVDAVYIMEEGRWRALGAMQPGARVDVRNAPVVGQTGSRLPGLPRVVQVQAQRGPCATCPPGECPSTKRGTHLTHEGTLVAWRRDAEARVAPDWPEGRLKGRVIWIIQSR